MTKTTKFKQKQRRNSFAADFNAQEDDFTLADVQVIADDSRLRITPLHHLQDDEDAIDRLLVNSGFDIDTGLNQTDEKTDAFAVIENIGVGDAIDAFDEVDPRDDEFFAREPRDNAQNYRRRKMSNDDLSVEMAGKNQDYLGKVPNNKESVSAYLAICPETQTDEPEPVEITIQAFETTEEPQESMAQQADIEPAGGIKSEHMAEHHVSATYPDMSALNPLKIELENLDIQHKKRLHYYKNKAKKAILICYMALGLAIVSIMATVAMSIMIADLKAEVSKLTALLEVVKDDIEALTEKGD